MYKAKAYSVASSTSPFTGATISRPDPTETDVQIEILFCGICHSDLHQARDEWASVMPTVYPLVPGHEIVGRVTKVGSAANKFKPGDLAPLAVSSFSLIMRRRNLSGSNIGGIAENSGDARFLQQAQHHRRCGGHPHPKSKRGVRKAA